VINTLLTELTNDILECGGTIDKYMGDCIMAFWNAPLACSNHAEMAVRAAKEIEVATKDLQQVYSQMGLPEIRVGTGINTGDCIVGNMGSTKRFDYSVIGDAVNLAARLEATAARGKYENVPTIYSSYTAQQLPPYVKSKKIGEVQVKGKSEVIEIYSFQ
jgi:adenylate cyclase